MAPHLFWKGVLAVSVAPDPWAEAIREAIGNNSAKAVVGTRFRQAVMAACGKRNLQFPPANEPNLPFLQLIERYPQILSVLRRPGQDFLVAPAERSDLLSDEVRDRLYGIRGDFFEAFTIISESHRPFYDKTADHVIWKKVTDPLTDSLISIDRPTEKTEVELRKAFADSRAESVPDARPQLLAALNEARPLQTFGNVVRADANLQREWHSFRTGRIVKKMQEWANNNELQWKNVWLTERPSYPHRISEADKSQQFSQDTSMQFVLPGLDTGDMQRIYVPLDLVIKIISNLKPTH